LAFAVVGSFAVAQAQVTYSLGESVDMLDPSFYAGQAEDDSNVLGSEAFFGHTSHDGKRIAFWAVNAANRQSSFFVVDVGVPASFRRITGDFGYTPSAPIYWTPDDSALIIGPYRIMIPPVGEISGLTALTIHGISPNDTSVTSLPANNWAFSLKLKPGVNNIVALPILGNGSEDPARQPVIITDFNDGTLSADWPSVSPDGTLVTFADYRGASAIDLPDTGNVYVLKNIQAILSAPLKPGTSISSLAPIDANDSNLIAVRAGDSDNFAHSPTFSQDNSLLFYEEDFNNVFANNRFFDTFPLGDFDIMISNADGSGDDFRLAMPGNQAFTSSTPAGIRILYDGDVAGMMHLFMSSIEVLTTVSGTDLGDNDVITTVPQEAEDGSGTVVTIPTATTINFPDGEVQQIQVLTPVNPVEPIQLPPEVEAIPVLRDFGPDGTTFNPAITVTITYTDAEILGLNENALRVFRFNPVSGVYDDEVTEGIVRDPANNRISFSVDHFSVYGLGGSTDTDGDGIPDSSDLDDDNDGIPDVDDLMPLDTDNDGVNNDTDPDDDSDGTLDFDDAMPLDTDNDGIDNNADPDDDNDGILDAVDAFLYDTDNDGESNAVDADDDGDGLSDADETYTHHTNPLAADSDGDGASDSDEITAGTDPNEPPAPPVPVTSVVSLLAATALLGSLGLRRLRARKH
jgi:hypothetical protein